mmetsp:Transcript_32412/g.89588  ORF Transcript_32412/g.89588 Transcript_32412/m.89588 type:complete len:292 (-) Transcript_32412:364-1239(-)
MATKRQPQAMPAMKRPAGHSDARCDMWLGCDVCANWFTVDAATYRLFEQEAFVCADLGRACSKKRPVRQPRARTPDESESALVLASEQVPGHGDPLPGFGAEEAAPRRRAVGRGRGTPQPRGRPKARAKSTAARSKGTTPGEHASMRYITRAGTREPELETETEPEDVDLWLGCDECTNWFQVSQLTFDAFASKKFSCWNLGFVCKTKGSAPIHGNPCRTAPRATARGRSAKSKGFNLWLGCDVCKQWFSVDRTTYDRWAPRAFRCSDLGSQCFATTAKGHSKRARHDPAH